jgi:hypothetical protein
VLRIRSISEYAEDRVENRDPRRKLQRPDSTAVMADEALFDHRFAIVGIRAALSLGLRQHHRVGEQTFPRVRPVAMVQPPQSPEGELVVAKRLAPLKGDFLEFVEHAIAGAGWRGVAAYPC